MGLNTIILYIDPGTGSLLISALISLILSILYSLRTLFYKASNFFFGIGGNTVYDFSGQLVFFSEGKAYWRVYEPVLAELIKRKQKVVYLSADKEDKGLSIASEYVESHYLGKIRQAIFILNQLKAKMCVMTTPQLDVIALKRSKHIQHYCHIIHSPTDIHAYKKFAFDYFDSVLCSSQAQIENLKFLEDSRNSRPKQLLQTGCTYYDVFLSDNESSGDSILIAPTWGDRTFFKSCGKAIISNLLEADHKVIFRPHPQSWISDKELLDDIITSFGSHANLTIDKETAGEKAISKSKLLICDITSGMLFDMAFVYKKSVVAIAFDWKDGGYESRSLVNPTAAVDLLEDVGHLVHAEEVENISAIVEESLSKVVSQEIIDKHIFNFQQAGKVAAEQIISIYKNLN
ncbi:MAG: CDP-glycerol glycerophosphotransferase family protein [Saprospiraceae bacterium]